MIILLIIADKAPEIPVPSQESWLIRYNKMISFHFISLQAIPD
jgi:hypothetical protein